MTTAEVHEKPRWVDVRSSVVWLLPLAYTAVWTGYVEATEQWSRIADTWRTMVTMVVGSFVAGSTPQGGGAVAFPVFTKVLEITAPVARTFSLSIQATGMVMASLTIVIAGRSVDWRAVTIGTLGGLAGFALGAFVLSDPSTLWWEPRMPATYVKVGFTVAIAAMAMIVQRCFVGGASGHGGLGDWSARASTTLFLLACVGGITSALAGSGADVFVFVFLVLIAGVHPKIGVPTSIITMALVSVAGLVLFGLLDGQLLTEINTDGDVVRVGDTALATPLDGTRFDLFGIWLGASVVVVWGAPLGSWVASKLSDRSLIAFVASMAIAEITTTLIFLKALREDAWLAGFGIAGLLLAFAAVRFVEQRREWFLA